MLEKRKEWFKENMEKGKKWVDAHRMEVGFVIGVSAAIGGIMIDRKIFETKEGGITITSVENKDGSWEDGFVIETFGVDRFGYKNDGCKVLFDLEDDAKWVTENVYKIADKIRKHNSKH